MNNNIYVIYDNTIETPDSLEKFKKILVLAGFTSDKIVNMSSDEYLTYLENNNFSFHNFVIAINQTYKIINQIYSERLDIPIFDFFNKEFVSTKHELVLFGILFSISSIYEPAYKKFSWGVIQRFFIEYNNFLSNNEPDQLDCDYLDPPQEIVAEQPSKEVIVETVALVVEESPVDDIPEQVVEKTLSYDELLAFYNNAQELISKFNLVQEQLKHIGSLRNE